MADLIHVEWLPEGWTMIEGSGKWRCSWCLEIATRELYEGRRLVPIVCNRPIGWEAKGKLVASYVVRSGLVTRRTREAQREDAHADD